MLANLVKDIIFLMGRIIQTQYKGEKYTPIVQLRYMMDCTYREIGHRLGASHQTIKLVDDHIKDRLTIEIKQIKSVKVSYRVEEELNKLKGTLPPILNAKRLGQYFTELLEEEVGNHFLDLLLSLIDYHLIYIEKQSYYVVEGLAKQVRECYNTVQEAVKILKREKTGKLAEQICSTNRIDVGLIAQGQDHVLLEILLDDHPSLVKIEDGQYELKNKNSKYRLELCYSILASAKRPLHTNSILQSMQLPESYYATLHNLIAFDPQQRLKLIGKSGYIALKDWNICCKSLKESIIDILKETEEGLSVAQIVRCLEARKQIPISANTVNAIITNHKHLFQRRDKKVFLCNASQVKQG